MNITSRIYKWRVCSPGSDVEQTRIKRGFLLLTFWSEQRLGKIAAHNFSWEGMRKKINGQSLFLVAPFLECPLASVSSNLLSFYQTYEKLLRTNLVITWLHWLPGDSLITLRVLGIAVGIYHSGYSVTSALYFRELRPSLSISFKAWSILASLCKQYL